MRKGRNFMFDKVVIISQDQELYHSLVSNGNKELIINFISDF